MSEVWYLLQPMNALVLCLCPCFWFVVPGIDSWRDQNKWSSTHRRMSFRVETHENFQEMTCTQCFWTGQWKSLYRDWARVILSPTAWTGDFVNLQVQNLTQGNPQLNHTEYWSHILEPLQFGTDDWLSTSTSHTCVGSRYRVFSSIAFSLCPHLWVWFV